MTSIGAMTAEELIRLPYEEMAARIKGWRTTDLERTSRWPFWQRADQQAPDGDWRIWLVMAGRGFGKTRMGAEWVRAIAHAHPGARIALVGATLVEARAVMVEGESGLLGICDKAELNWEPSLRRLTWANGAVATLYSAAEPESLRGPQHDYAWADEIAKWPCGIAAWDNLMLGLRLGEQPKVMATTTPRPVPLVRRLNASRKVAKTYGCTEANRPNLPTEYLDEMQALYGGTRWGRQELNGELIDDAQGALWTRDLIEHCRVAAPPALARVVIAVDPPASAGGDACGIVAAGLGQDGKAYVLADHSIRGASPDRWARAVAAAAEIWGADRVIAEANQGGDMVISTLRAADVTMPVKKVHATRSKTTRAEPVAALYEAGKAFHAGPFPDLEDELCGLITGGGYEGPGRSPDRADALVWAMTELMLASRGVEPRVRQL